MKLNKGLIRKGDKLFFAMAFEPGPFDILTFKQILLGVKDFLTHVIDLIKLFGDSRAFSHSTEYIFMIINKNKFINRQIDFDAS